MSDLVDIKIVSSQTEFSDAMEVRRSVFVNEQKIDPNLEFDGNDFSATHIIAYYEDKPVGTIRLRYFKDFVKIERLCVIKEMRKTNISDLLIDSCLAFSAQKGYEYAHALCKKELLSRWAKEDFFPIDGAPCVFQNGMTLVPIEKKMSLPNKHITLQTSPEILNLKEGEWFEKAKVKQATPINRTKQIEHFADMILKIRTLKIMPCKKIINWHPPLKYDFIDIFTDKSLFPEK